MRTKQKKFFRHLAETCPPTGGGKGEEMKKLIILAIIMLTANVLFASDVLINEIRANDDGGDDIEFIELIGKAGTEITGFKITHYNGAESVDGDVWTHTIGTFTIPDDGITDSNGNALGFYVLGLLGWNPPEADESRSDELQNGPDGIVLYDASDNILDAVAWEGAGDMTDDDPGTVTTDPPTTANNYLHVTVDDDAGDNSLQAPNNVLGDDGTAWALYSSTEGGINSGQTSGSIIMDTGGPLPLTISNISREHKVPTASQSCWVQCNITGGTPPYTAVIKYNVDGVPQANISMSNTGGDTYQGTLPIQNDGARVEYYIEVTDNAKTTETSLTYGLFWGTSDIFKCIWQD